MQELLVESGRPVLAVLTKADKLGRSAQRERARAIGQALALPEDQVQLTSARSGEGIADLGASILALVTLGQKLAPTER
jgi:GTP-binding protein EngB required for normal cell division